MRMLLHHWSICTSPVWAVLVLISYGHAEIFDFTKCDITDNFKSEFVSASFKSLDAGLGCESNSSTSSGQEVHIIAVSPTESDDDEDRVTVKLSIHSRRQANLDETEGVDFHEDPLPAIFVLHSTVPIRWKVEMHGVSSQEKHIFMLSKESFIRFLKKRTRMMVKSRKRVLPFSTDSEQILAWTQRRFGAVTSYSTTKELNLKFYLGRDVSAGSSCDVKALRPSLRIFSYQEVIKPITGCVSKRRSTHVRTKPVYIIELLEAPNHSPGMTGIDLEITPYQSGLGLKPAGDDTNDGGDDWNFYLVVKSLPGLTWVLHSKKISGWVDIVADAGATVKVTSVKISTVALRAEVMKVTGRQLVEWSQDYIAPVHMYAGVHAANTIKLRVPPLERNMASPRERVSVTDPVDLDYKNERAGVWDNEDFGKVKKFSNLASLIQTTCTKYMMEVTIPNKVFQLTGLDKTKVSLKDPSCRPTAETDDHIIFCVGLLQCGTQSVGQENVTSFTNAVVIQTSPGLVSSLLQDELGSGFFEEETGSGSRDLSVLVDDEDFTSNPVSIRIECKVAESLLSNKEVSDGKQCLIREPRPAPKCSMNIFSTLLFLRARIDFPVTVAKDSFLYVKAGVIDQDITLMVDSCWFSTSSQPNDKSAETREIVSRGCSKDSTLSWMDDPLEAFHNTNLRYTKFKVKVTDMFHGRSPLFLHCQFQTCQRGGGFQDSKCSINRELRCHQSIQPSTLDDQPAPDCGPLTVGPLDLTDKEVHVKPPTGGSGTRPVSNKEEHSPNQQQRIIIEGLDSATVVGIAFAAFAIGIILTGALWLIHSQTGPGKRGVTAHREADASGDMTPNSSSPMTA